MPRESKHTRNHSITLMFFNLTTNRIVKRKMERIKLVFCEEEKWKKEIEEMFEENRGNSSHEVRIRKNHLFSLVELTSVGSFSFQGCTMKKRNTEDCKG